MWGSWAGQSAPCASPSLEGRTEEQGLELLSSACTDKGRQREVGGSEVAGSNDRSQGHILVGHPSSPDFPSRFHFALLGFLLEPKEATPLCEPLWLSSHVLSLEPVPAPGTHDHGRAGHSHTCSSDSDPQYPPRTAKPGKGEEQIPSRFSCSVWS